MEVVHILLEVTGDHAVPGHADGLGVLEEGEAHVLHQFIVHHLGREIQELRVGKAGAHLRHHRGDHAPDLGEVHLLRLLDDLGDHGALALRPLIVVPGGITDPAVGHGLDPVRQEGPGADCGAVFPGGLHQGRDIVLGLMALHGKLAVHGRRLVAVDRQLDSPQEIHDIHHRVKVHGDEVLDIQVQVGVEHSHGLFRPARLVGGVRLIIGTVGLVQEGIPVNGTELQAFRVVIDRGDDDGVGAAREITGLMVIDPEQGDRRIALEDLHRFRVQLVDLQLLDLDLLAVDLGGDLPLVAMDPDHHQEEDHDDLGQEQDELRYALSLFLLSS